MRIAMPRGDIKWVRFKVQEPDGDLCTLDFTSIYFSVKKKNARDARILIQKSLKANQFYKLADGDYQTKLSPRDTRDLPVGEYLFDIQIGYKNIIKESFIGDFVLKPEITTNDYDEDEYNPTVDENEDDDTEIAVPEDTALILKVPEYLIIKLETPAPIPEGENDDPIPESVLEEITENGVGG